MKKSAFLLFAIIIPMITFFIEIITGFCAVNIFDPMAHWPMIPAILSVPVIYLIHHLKQNGTAERITYPWLIGATGWSLVISLYYCLIFGPLLGFGLVGILFLGIGLLPMTPIFTFFGGLFAWRKVRKETGKRFLRPGIIGLVIACEFLFFVEGPSWLTHIEISRLSEDFSFENLESVSKNIKRFGSIDTCHRRLFGPSIKHQEPATVAYSWLRGNRRREELDSTRQVYYRLTGKSGNESQPRHRPALMSTAMARGQWDPNVGGDSVAGLIRGLQLNESFLSAKIETASGLAYQEWTVELKNRTAVDREGRCVVLLPAGSVVSRLTLWVNGEPREAAFAGSAKVKAAYRKIAVVQRKDPVLVQWAGPDRIFVQCFPVPRSGGTLKFRIGYITKLSTDVPPPPLIVDRNFEVPKSLRHSIRYHSDQNLLSGTPSLEVVDHPRKGTVLMGHLTPKEVAGITFPGKLENEEPPPTAVWTEDKLNLPEKGKKYLLRETIPPPSTEKQPTNELVFVIDSSISMKPHLAEICEALESLPAETVASLIVAGVKTEILSSTTTVNSKQWKKAIAALRQTLCSGGIDNAEALTQGFSSIKPSERATLVWIHGQQPFETYVLSRNELRMALELRPDVVWRSLSVEPGSNYILKKFSTFRQLQFANRLTNALKQIVKIATPDPGIYYRWSRFPEQPKIQKPTVKVSDILARFRAFELAKAALASGKWNAEETKKAAHYQLVTPFTGAVVLETEKQFKDNGLEPVDPSTVPDTPTVPEPEFYLLLFLVGAAFLIRQQRRKRKTTCY